MNSSTHTVFPVSPPNLALKLRLIFSICLLVPLRMLGAAPSALAPTTTVLTISPEGTVAVGNLVTLRASVSSAGQPVSPGQVIFCNADALHCEDFSILGRAQLTRDGSASINVIPRLGLRNVRAEFRGTNSLAASASSPVGLTVTGGYATTTTISPVQTLDTYAFSSTVTGRGQLAPSGLVVYRDAANKNLPVASGTVTSSSVLSTSVTSSTGPNALICAAVADLNGDGIPDQLAFDSTNDVVVLLGKGDGTFKSGPITPVGANPSAIAVGDFNNDGLPDFAVTNSGDGTAGVYLAIGNGLFSPVITIPVGTGAGTLTSGDFSHDGNLDLAVSWSGGLSIFLGDGTGHFSLKSTVPNATALPDTSIHVADVNGEGNDDLLLTNTGVQTYLGNGDGTFSLGGYFYCAYAQCSDLAVADFNGDGKPDLVVINAGVMDFDNNVNGIIDVRFGYGNGFFGSPNFVDGGYPDLVSIGDFDGDGTPDIAVTRLDNGLGASIYLNDGSGNLLSNGYFGPFSNLSPLQVGDFDNDGVSDFVAAGDVGPVELSRWTSTFSSSNADVSLGGSIGLHNLFANYVGDQTHLTSLSGTIALQGPKASTTLALNVSPLPASAGQTLSFMATISSSAADGDQATGTVTFYSGSNLLGSGSVSAGHVSFSTSSLPTGTGNIILTAHYGGDTRFAASASLPVQLTRAGTLRPGSVTELTVSPTSQAPAGTVITLSANVAGGGNTVRAGLVRFYDEVPQHSGQVLLGQAQITRASVATFKLRLGIGQHSLRAVFQGTNALSGSTSASKDLTVTGQPGSSAQASTGVVPEYSLQPQLPIGVGANQATLAPADFNGDGILDIATVTLQNKLAILLGNPDGTFIERGRTGLPINDSESTSIVGADFNSDGIPDLAVQHGGLQGFVTILMGKGDGTFSSRPEPAVGPRPYSVLPGDFNSDGVPDLLVVNEGINNSPSYSVLLGKGDGTFTTTTIPLGTGIYPESNPVGADLNEDGTLDIVIPMNGALNSNSGYTSLTLLLGGGDGTFTTQTTSPVTLGCGSASPLAVADFNGDGFQDLFFTECGNTTHVLLGNGDATFTPLALASNNIGGGLPISADLSGDGIPDLLLAGGGSPQVQILLGKGDGLFTAGAVASTYQGYTSGVAVGDFNGDGIPDVITANQNRQTISEWFGTITAAPPAP